MRRLRKDITCQVVKSRIKDLKSWWMKWMKVIAIPSIVLSVIGCCGLWIIRFFTAQENDFFNRGEFLYNCTINERRSLQDCERNYPLDSSSYMYIYAAVAAVSAPVIYKLLHWIRDKNIEKTVKENNPGLYFANVMVGLKLGSWQKAHTGEINSHLKVKGGLPNDLVNKITQYVFEIEDITLLAPAKTRKIIAKHLSNPDMYHRPEEFCKRITRSSAGNILSGKV